MIAQLRLVPILLLVLVLTSLGTSPAPATHATPVGLPDELLSAVLAASAQPFAASGDGYYAHSGGLQVTLRPSGLQANVDGMDWSLSLHGWGRSEQAEPPPQADIVQSDSRLEYRRGLLTEWYRDTALGVDQGLAVLQAPAGEGPLVVQFDVTTELAGTLDADGRGMSFAAPEGQVLRYDHLNVWDANAAALEAHMIYAPGQIRLEIEDRTAVYPITVDPLIYREQKVTESAPANIQFGESVAVYGDTALVGALYGTPEGGAKYRGSAYVFVRSGTTWTLQQILTASDGATADKFGSSVALSADTAVVGASFDDIGGNTDQGSAYVFVRSGTTWTQQAKLTANDGMASDLFGLSVSLSGDTALIGAYDWEGAPNHAGSAYVFVRSGTNWSQQAKLTAPDGTPYDYFGISVALSVNTALVGAPNKNSAQGSTYVFTRSGTTWSLQTQLAPSDGAANDRFGGSVALSGETALVGAWADKVGANAWQGSAYVFVRSGTVWTQQAKLTSSDGASQDEFGLSVALSGDNALVGSPQSVVANTMQGAAYMFSRSGTTWTQQAKFAPTDGAWAQYFGRSVALSGGTALMGAFQDSVGLYSSQGSALVVVWTGMSWSPQAKLTAPEGAPSDHFGYSVAISGDIAVVGAISEDIGASTDQGSAYVFSRSGTIWTVEQKLTASDGAANDGFGWSVAISGTTALVGAPYKNRGMEIQQGAAYVFVQSYSGWTQQAKLTAADGLMGDLFGYSVALSGNTALVGAYQNDADGITDKGAVYVFTRSGNSWTQQQKLTASDGSAGDRFGGSVALSGTTALVGALYDTVGTNGMQGSAYVFVWTGATWAPQSHLIASDGRANDLFGHSVALSGDTALIGARGHSVGGQAYQGSAYVFSRSGTTWTQQAQLTASDGAANDNFGYSVGLSGDRALVGAIYDDVGANANQGSAYLYKRSGTTWTQQAKWAASDGAGMDYFGNSTALSGYTALVGSYYDDFNANVDQGSAYFYDILYGTYLPLLQRAAP